MEKKYIEMAEEVLSVNKLLEKKSEIFKVLESNGKEQNQYIEMAQKYRNDLIGNKLFIRGSLEYSNICSNTCAFCGMSARNNKLKRYTLTFEEAKKSIDKIKKYGVKQLHLVAGEYAAFDIGLVYEIIFYAKEIGLEVTLVLGEIDENRAEKLFQAGARRYICKFETSNSELYFKYKSGKKLVDRIANLFLLRDIGYKIGTGVIVGLPGTSLEDLFNDLSVLININPDMASLSIFKSNSASALANMRDGDKNLGLKFLALMRMSLRNTPIITCSSSFDGESQINALNAGANLMTMHVTPERVAEEFSMYIYGNRIMTQYEHILRCSKLANMEITEYE